MGLAANQARLLTLTYRKPEVELGISLCSLNKMSLTREMSLLSQEYQSRLQSKQIAYYADGKYNKVNYNYLMGDGLYSSVLEGNKPRKEQNSMILSDFKGRAVLSDAYANAITSVLGKSAMDKDGRGGTFSTDNIAAILAELCPGLDQEQFQKVINEEDLDSAYNAHNRNTLSGEETGDSVVVDNSDVLYEKYKQLVDFYYPIFAAAAANGWTTEYNKDMALNEDYVSDALVSGTFQLANVNNAGEYDEGTSLTYFITAGMVESRTDADAREEVTAWYNAEKERISAKETYWDLQINDLSTELEAIKTEMESIQSFIDDAIGSIFDWGTS